MYKRNSCAHGPHAGAWSGAARRRHSSRLPRLPRLPVHFLFHDPPRRHVYSRPSAPPQTPPRMRGRSPAAGGYRHGVCLDRLVRPDYPIAVCRCRRLDARAALPARRPATLPDRPAARRRKEPLLPLQLPAFFARPCPACRADAPCAAPSLAGSGRATLLRARRPCSPTCRPAGLRATLRSAAS